MQSGPPIKLVIRIILLIIIAVCKPALIHCQTLNDTLGHAKTLKDTSLISLKKDTSLLSVKKDSTQIAVKKDESGLKSKVKYSARDSMRFDVANQKMYLFGNAQVIYEDLKLVAGYIELDMRNNIVYASGRADSAGKEVELPVFTEKTQNFKSHKMTYNFQTKKGQINEVITQESGGYIHGQVVKKDSSNTVYIQNGKYTTCDLENPHFYIQAKKLKVVPNDKIVTGPAYLVINGVPTPLIVPFGFFPNKSGQKSGLIIPTYGESATQGFFLTNGGYYWGISDLMDAAFTGNIYSKGSWGAETKINYVKRYDYTGTFDFKYSKFITGDIIDPTTYTNQDNFLINWSHRQDSKANPGTTFSASVNAGTSSYNRINSYANPNLYLQNTLASNINWSKTMGPNNLFNLVIAARHDQNTETKAINISLPQIDLSMNRIYPFKSSTSTTPMWYDKIGVGYGAEIANTVNTYDSLFLKPAMFKQMKNGFHQSIPISASFNALKYFTITPSFNDNTNVYYQTISEHYDKNTKQIVTDTVSGVQVANDMSFATNMSTKLYGNYMFHDSPVKQIRHVITPTIGFSYRPDYSEQQWGYYKTVKDSTGATRSYSKFQNGLYGTPASGQSSVINWSINNTLEAKVRDPKDSVNHERKISIIDFFTISSSYNTAVSQFKMSNISLSGRTKLFKRLDVNYSGILDPYQVDAEGNRIEKLEFDKDGAFGRLINYSISLSTSLHSGGAANPANNPNNANKPAPTDPKVPPTIPEKTPSDYDFNIPWNLTMNYGYYYTAAQGSNPEQLTQSFSFNGDVKLTKKWKIAVTSGYDLKVGKLTYTNFSIYRDLHCWEMKINWVPFGPSQSYMLTINVKSAVLQDLKLSRQRAWYDSL